jgi:hypothetical protein
MGVLDAMSAITAACDDADAAAWQLALQKPAAECRTACLIRVVQNTLFTNQSCLHDEHCGTSAGLQRGEGRCRQCVCLGGGGGEQGRAAHTDPPRLSCLNWRSSKQH